MIENLKNTNLLYVEDDEIIRKQYVYVFKNFFASVTEAATALEGLDHFEKLSFQCIISDIVMNDINGIEFIQEIRKRDQKIPIVIFSSHPTQKYLLESIKLNLTSFLIKPASFMEIKNALEECAEKMLNEQLLHILIGDNIYYCPIKKTVFESDNSHVLTKKEALFIELLIKNRTRLVTREQIENLVYFDQEMSESALKNLILRLRKKISADIIINVVGHGYLLK